MTLNWGQAASSVPPVRAKRFGNGGVALNGQPTWAATATSNGISNIAALNRPRVRQRMDYARRAVGEAFQEYCRTTKVNGLYYLRRGATEGSGRRIWIALPAVLLVLAVLLVFSLWQRYLGSPTRMTIGSPLSVAEVPFPAVTICHPQSVIEYKAKDFVERIKYPAGVTKSKLLDALPMLGILTEHQWTDPNKEEVTLVNNVLQLNNISIFSAIMQLGKTCEDFLLECRFAGEVFPCFQDHKFLSWTTTTSHYGTCCSFHYHPLHADFQPFAANTFGSEGGLTIVGTGQPQVADGRSGVLLSAGFVSMLHHPSDFAMETSPTILLSAGQETFVAIYPTDLRCSEQVLALPEAQRKCINPWDYEWMETYRQSSCILDCFREAVHGTCQCHPYNLPEKSLYGRQRPIRECNLIDGLCLVKNYAKFKTTQCDCLPPCNDVTYKISTFTSRLSEEKRHSVSPIYQSTNLTEFEFIAHFYMANQIVPTNMRIVVMSWITLLSNLGGVFSLCMGISVISLIEIVYFLGIRLRHHYVQQRQGDVANLRPNVLQVLQLGTSAAEAATPVELQMQKQQQQQQRRW